MWLTGSCPASWEITRPGKRLKFRLWSIVSAECLLFPHHHKVEKSWSWIGAIFTFGEGGRSRGRRPGFGRRRGRRNLSFEYGCFIFFQLQWMNVLWITASLAGVMTLGQFDGWNESRYYPTSPCLIVRLVLLHIERLVIFHMLSAFDIWVEVHCPHPLPIFLLDYFWL